MSAWGEAEEPREPPVVRDKRRLDPLTGELRDAGAGAPADPAAATKAEGAALERELADDVGRAQALQAELDETRDKESVLVNDLRRLQAEYVNYRKRVDRDRDVAREVAVAGVLQQLLPVLDDIGRARDHGDLEGAFRTVAEALEATVAKLGLERYGQEGEPFDPSVHEALMHAYDESVTEATCAQVLFPGYRLGERVLRPARVAVSEPPA